MRCVIFDLDGTLADTSGDLIAAANACFEGLGHGPLLDPLADASTAFRGGKAMLKLGFSRLPDEDFDLDAAIDAQFPVLLAAYGDAIDTHTKIYPGAIAAIEMLRADGYAVGVCTNKPEGLAETLLQRLGIRDLFGSMIGADTLPVRKPDAAPYVAAVEQAGGALGQSFLVGDTATDRNTARAAGVPCALVTFGPDGRQVAELEPEALMDHYDDLAGIAKRLIS